MTTTTSDYGCKANHYYKWGVLGSTNFVKVMYHVPCNSTVYVRFLCIATFTACPSISVSTILSSEFDAIKKTEITSDVFNEALRDVIGTFTAIQQKEYDDKPIEWVRLYVLAGWAILYSIAHLFFDYLVTKGFLIMARKRFKIARLCSSDNYRLSRAVAAYYGSNPLTIDTKDISCSVKDLIAAGKHPYVMCFGSLVKLSLSDAAKVCKDMEIVWK